MTTRQIIRVRGSASGVINGSTSTDQIQWSLDIKLPKGVSLKNEQATKEILVQSTIRAIASSLPPLTQSLSKSETGVKSGKFCPVCGGTNIHEQKCPNQQLRLRGFKK